VVCLVYVCVVCMALVAIRLNLIPTSATVFFTPKHVEAF